MRSNDIFQGITVLSFPYFNYNDKNDVNYINYGLIEGAQANVLYLLNFSNQINEIAPSSTMDLNENEMILFRLNIG